MTTVAIKWRHSPEPTSSGECPPAPVQTMLATLARLASHVAFEPTSITLTQGTRTISVNVAGRAAYLAWRWYVDAQGAILRGDELGTLSESSAYLHGWLVQIRIVGTS